MEREKRIARAQRKLFAQLGRAPTDDEIAAEAEVSLDHLSEMQDVPRTVTSLDKVVDTEEETPLRDRLQSHDVQPAEEVELSLREEIVRQAMAKLPDEQRTVLQLRYGIASEGDPSTIDEVVRRLGISRNRVRRLEADGLARAREIAALHDPV